MGGQGLHPRCRAAEASPGRKTGPGRSVRPMVLSLLALGLGVVQATSAPPLAGQVTGAPPVGTGGPTTEAWDAATAARVEAVLSRPLLQRIHWGILLMDPSDGRILYQRNPDLPFVPASNQKIPVTWGALQALGPDFRFVTPFHAPSFPEAGVVRGDLVVRGSGDPSLGPPFHPTGEAALVALARRVSGAGIREVDGALVVDVSAWDSTSVPTGWLVGNLSREAAATGGAFAVGLGRMEITVVGGAAPGNPAQVSWRPRGSPGFVENRVRTGTAAEGTELEASYLPESRRWVVEGTLPPGARRTLRRPQRDPVHQAAHGLLRALEGEGVRVRDGVRIAWAPREAPPPGVEVARHESPPLMALVREVLAPSQNWMTEQLVRTLGALQGDEGSWEEGFRVLHHLLDRELGVDSLDIHFRDGSGLAGYNLVTPRALATILRRARGEAWGLAYREAMATPGDPDGTLTHRLPTLRGRVYAKTGSITHVNALSGYLVDASGEERVFVIMTNAGNQPAARVRGGIDDVLRALAGGR